MYLIAGFKKTYDSVASRDNGVESVKENAPDAPDAAIDDQT
jgi:uncharacterized protein YegP (UPF0339 family)